MGEEFEFEVDMDLDNIVEDLENQIVTEVERRFGKDKSGDDVADYKYIFRCHVTMK
jgi:hypothetical protein